MVFRAKIPRMHNVLEVGIMKSIEYVKKEERIIESLLEMLDHSARRMEQSKDVPALYAQGNHRAPPDIYRRFPYDEGRIHPIASRKPRRGTPERRSATDTHASLRKHERFLLKVIEAYDLGYQGARSVFPTTPRNTSISSGST